MLIRVRGGEAGIKAYLESGRKDGRDYARAELDERVILAGDLELTDTLIHSMDKKGDRYLHITLAFKEDEIGREPLQAITEEFEAFAMSAYEVEEYHFYAEAHLPRLKSYTHQRTGEFIERKPHIHIVIPQYNLLSEQNLNPFGRVDQQTPFLDAFQEHINAKYGLASPKDNRRMAFTDESAIIARYKGDYFKGAHHALKARILSEVLDKGVSDFERFRALVAEYGETKTRNAGKPGEYLNVKPAGAAKGVNLKEYVFSREFIELPEAEKRRRLAGEIKREYDEAQAPRPTPGDMAERLREWREMRAYELKYINSGNRKLYAAYRDAGPAQRRALLAERAATFYAKHRDVGGIEHDPEPPAQAPERGRVSEPAPSRERDGRQSDTVVGQYAAEHRERSARGAENSREAFATIKRALDAARLLTALSRTHGVIPAKYAVTQGKDGGHRIRCGRRNLNVSDFLTQELHLPWREAAPILRKTYAEQRGRAVAQQARSAPRRAEARRAYQAERRAIQNDRRMTPAERKGALSVARMDKVTRDMHLRAQLKAERDALKARYRMKPAEQYRAYLAERAERGEVDALAELRRQRVQETNLSAERIEPRTPGLEGEEAFLMKSAVYTVDRAGHVTYYDDQRRALFTDSGRAVAFARTERDTLEKGLCLALAKFGPRVRLNGTDGYKRQMVDIAADAGLRVDFNDPALNARYRQRLAAIKAGREYIERAAKRDQQTPAQAQVQTTEREQPQRERQPRPARGYSR